MRVAEILKRNLKEAIFLVRLVLWLFATRLGTILIYESLNVCRGFPFINKFLEMIVEKREKVLKRWNREKSFVIFRITFVTGL